MSSADEKLEISVVRGMGGVGGVCEMCMCWLRAGCEWMRGLGLGFTNLLGTWGVWYVWVAAVLFIITSSFFR